MELLALFDKDGNPTTDKIERNRKKEIPKGRYFRCVLVFIQNDQNQFLIQRVSKVKGHVYATTGGHVSYGYTSLETALKEVEEELGIQLNPEELQLFETEHRSIAFQDSYYVKKNINIKNLVLQSEEVEEVSWMSQEEILALIEKEQFRPGNIYPFYDLLDFLQDKFPEKPLFFYRNRPFQKD